MTNKATPMTIRHSPTKHAMFSSAGLSAMAGRFMITLITLMALMTLAQAGGGAPSELLCAVSLLRHMDALGSLVTPRQH
eukprot:2978547-Rhodomonas_salina.1